MNPSDFAIISFGEASHGSNSDYQAREKLVDYLLTFDDTVNILVEMQHGSGVAIEAYRQNLIDSSSLLEKLIFYGLQTDSFIHFINRYKNNSKVRFFGFDMQRHQGSLDYLKGLLLSIYPERAQDIENCCDSLDYNFTKKFDASEYLAYEPVVARNVDHLSFLVRSYNEQQAIKFELSISLRVLIQYFEMVDYVMNDQMFEYRKHREISMAENVCFYQKHLGSCLVLAANAHVLKFEDFTMGSYLQKEFGKRYYVIASQYLGGCIMEVQGGKILTRSVNPIRNSIPDKLERMYGLTADTIIFTGDRNSKSFNYFEKQQLYQDFGIGRHKRKKSYGKSGYSYCKPSDHCDAFYLIYESTPSAHIQ